MTIPLIAAFFLDNLTGWGVGEQGSFVQTTDGGSTWSYARIPGISYVNDVWFTSKDTGLVVTGFGSNQVYKTVNGGRSWKAAVTPKTNYFLNSIHFSHDTLGWCAGFNGAILSSSDAGSTWKEQISGTTNDLYAIYFCSGQSQGYSFKDPDSIGYAVGENGTILKTIDYGKNWMAQVSGVTSTIETVFFTDSLHGWCAGKGGVILHTRNGGKTWSKQSSNTYTTLYTIQFIDSLLGYAAGDYGTILKTTNGGESWLSLTSGTGNTLYSLWFTDANTGYFMGTYGTILKTTTGGVSVVQEIAVPNSGLTIYPNPARGYITVCYKGKTTDHAALKVYDLRGVLRLTVRWISQDGNQLMDVSSLQKGTYLVILETERVVVSKKLLIR